MQPERQRARGEAHEAADWETGRQCDAEYCDASTQREGAGEEDAESGETCEGLSLADGPSRHPV
jgi:hypothetical protein